jgi:uncharacterized lipoprotein YajG
MTCVANLARSPDRRLLVALAACCWCCLALAGCGRKSDFLDVPPEQPAQQQPQQQQAPGTAP